MLLTLLPPQKPTIEIVACEPYAGTSAERSEGEKKREVRSIREVLKQFCMQGMRVSDIQKVSPWDLLDGYKGWSWSWFQVRVLHL